MAPVDPQSFVPSFPPLAAFGGSPIYFTGEDALRLSVQNAAAGVTVTLRGRMLPFGATRPVPFTQTLIPATDRSVSSVVVGIGDGWLLNAQAFVSAGSPATGQCFARLSVQKGLATGGDDLFSLCADYITAKQPVSYPGSGVLDSTDGAGALRSIAGTTPAAGAEISETVPTGARWDLLSFYAILTASATAANRQPVFVLDDGANTYFSACVPANLTASVTWQISWANGIQPLQSLPARPVLSALPVGVQVGAGHRLRTVTTSLQVDDQFSAVRYLVRERIEGA